MERKSQVQISKDLLLALFQYHLAGNEEYLPEIEKALMEKLDSIAGMVGYDNASKFSNSFKSIMGINPSEYKKSV